MKGKTFYLFAALLAVGLALDSHSDAAAAKKSKIEMVYQSQPNGDFRLYLFGEDRVLVCEEKKISIVDQGDAVKPLVLECKH